MLAFRNATYCGTEVLHRSFYVARITQLNRYRHRWPGKVSCILEFWSVHILGQGKSNLQAFTSRIERSNHLISGREADVDGLHINVALIVIDKKQVTLIECQSKVLLQS